MQPFLRWAGGKRWLVPRLAPVLKSILVRSGGVYSEPFLGSGAMFFGLAPQRAILSDLNSALIETYQVVSRDYRPVEDLLRTWPVDADFYYALRESSPSDSITRAARFIYLNRTCYGGLYRENRQGRFNTPYGGGSRCTKPVLEQSLLQRAHFALRNVTIRRLDFEIALDAASEDDVVYCDPTYTRVNRSGFDRYGSTIFDWAAQRRLAAAAQAAMERGAVVVVSNGYFDELHELYPAAYRIKLEKKKAIGNRARSSANHAEYLLVLDPRNRRQVWERVGNIENRKSRRRFRLETEDSSSSRAA